MNQIPSFMKTRTVLVLTAIAATLPLSLAGDGAMSGNGYYNGTSDISSRAIARLQTRTDEAMRAVETGRTLYKDGEYEKALAEFQKAADLLPVSPMTSDRRAYIEKLVATGTIAVAQQYRKTGEYEKATEMLKKILEIDPSNRAAKQELAYLADPVRTNPALTPKHVENVKEVNSLLQKAYGAYDLGEYDNAIKHFNQVLRIDPYSVAARRGKERMELAKQPYRNAAYDETRAVMLGQVSQAWELPVPAEAPKINENGSAPMGLNSPAVANMMKLKQIIIPTVDFENTTVEEAIEFLRNRSRSLDTSTTGEKGINFIIRTNAGGTPSPSAAPVEELDLELEDSAPIAAAPTASGSAVIPELKLKNVPMLEVLKFITENTGMRYKVEDFAIVILPSGQGDTDLFNKNFSVPPNFMTALGGGGTDGGETADPFASGGEESSGSKIKPRGNIKDLLLKSGVNFPDGASATYIPTSSTLIVRNTMGNVDMIEQLIEQIKATNPMQVKITTKFVEVSQENTDELSFDWVVSPMKVGDANRWIGGGSQGNSVPVRYPDNFVGPPSGQQSWVDGISGSPTSPVNNLVTGGNRTGSGAINGDSIDSMIRNPNRSSTTAAAAPGIMSFTGIFDEGSMQVIMRGLSQKKGTDVMTAPSITAKNGETARIEVVRQFLYPESYTEPQLPTSMGSTDNGNWNNGSGDGTTGGGSPAQISSFPVTPSTPESFAKKDIGVTLEIVPNIQEGTPFIDFSFVPEITEFDGFINYGSPISTAGIDGKGNPVTVVITENRIEQPVFSVRRVQTSLFVYDGHTVSIGGLMKESVQTIEDSVPILGDLPLVGRLFRSEANNHIKSNLIIFVTGDIIDATGRPVRNRESALDIDAGVAPISAEEGLLPTM